MIHNFLSLHLLLEGSLRYFFEKDSIRVNAGDVLVVPEMIPYGFESKSTGRYYHKLVLEVRGSALRFLCAEFGFPRKPIPLPGRLELFRPFAGKARTALREYTGGTNPELSGLSYELLARIAMELSGSKQTETPLLARVRGILDRDIRNEKTLSEIAAEAGLGRVRLNRMFREEWKVTPTEYRIRRKMEHALELLEQGFSVKETAYQLGYCNPFYFSSEFKRFYGVSPKKHRM